MLARRIYIPFVVASMLCLRAGANESELVQRPGIRGHVIIDPAFLNARQWPVDASRQRLRATRARLRRPSGHSQVGPLKEPRPELSVVLVGARAESRDAKVVHISGLQFHPSQMLLPRPGVLTVQNQGTMATTIVDGYGKTLAQIAAGKSEKIRLEAGETILRVEEMPFITATVRVLEKARVVPIGPTGEIAHLDIEGGDYDLAFYLGAVPLLIRPFRLTEDRIHLLEATLSAGGVVDVSMQEMPIGQTFIPHYAAPVPPKSETVADE